ncbi:MAG: hypothetical protein EOO38_11370 [Cytophagaceae bacterium]|nr:MAG: hypothetical protein EOO38_11370 [Cytophagaceae bacterium]
MTVALNGDLEIEGLVAYSGWSCSWQVSEAVGFDSTKNDCGLCDEVLSFSSSEGYMSAVLLDFLSAAKNFSAYGVDEVFRSVQFLGEIMAKGPESLRVSQAQHAHLSDTTCRRSGQAIV